MLSITLWQEICDATLTTTKQISLRWVCHDPDLIKYIHDEYVQPLLSLPTVSDVCLRVVLHNTSTTHVLEPDANGKSDECCDTMDHGVGNIDKDDTTTEDDHDGGSDNGMIVSGANHADDEEEQPCDERGQGLDPNVVLYGRKKTGKPFFHARLHGDNKTVYENVPGFLLFSLMCLIGMWALLWIGNKHTFRHDFLPRFAFLGVYGGIAVLTAFCAGLMRFGMRGRTSGHVRYSILTHTDEDRPDGGTDHDETTMVGHYVQNLESSVQFEEVMGRPDVTNVLHEDLLQHKNDHDSQAVIQCGPVALMEAVQEAVARLNKREGLLHRQEKRVALFEEIFEM